MSVERSKRIAEMPDHLRAQMDKLTGDRTALIQNLKALLLFNRVRTVAGFKSFRCRACDFPHLNANDSCKSNCPHHGCVSLLRDMGVDVSEII